jgi:pimeloyl-ACP methyl ester carboxylesterase
METERRVVVMPDGRDVEVLATGAADGLPLVVHDGTPSGLLPFPPVIKAATERGLRVIMYARPGYERSTPRPGRRVADVPGDVAAILAELDAETFVTVGSSGGGPHSLACAALLPDACLAAASVAGVAPYGVEGLDWTAGMGPENVAEFEAAVAGEAALTRFLSQEADGLGAITGADVVGSLGGLVDAADKAVITGEFADYLAAVLRAGVSAGIAGWRDDDLAFVSDWGFTLGWEAGFGEAILHGSPRPHAPVAIWQGDQDRMVPFGHGRWLAARIPGARSHLMPGEGHLSLTVTAFGDILDDLLDLSGIA